MDVPLIPESAPFTPGQRAWLNGFFAGLLSLDPQTLAAGPSNGSATAVAEDPAASAMADEEEMPWHDPALNIDERMTMVTGKPLPLQLMGAMAQLDCGACGYECRTYSQAIAEGSEKDLTRCVPGGKETAKALKQILADSGGTAPAAVATSDKPQTATSTGYGRNRPFPAPLLAVKRLTKEGSQKDVRFIALDLSGSSLTYEVGDSLGVYPVNCPELVEEILARLDASGDAQVRHALLNRRTITQVPEEVAAMLADAATDASEAAALRRMITDDDLLAEMDLLDILTRHPSARPSPSALIEKLTPLQPRLYSISSSLAAHPDEVHLTVGVVRYELNGRLRKGVASTFFAERFESGQTVDVFVQKSHGFRLPADGGVPIIMVGPGTGIAPFRAFLEERKASGATGPNWLLFGEQRREFDFLYEHELSRYVEEGVLARLDTAFSRDQEEKVYVQHRMLEAGAEIWRWLSDGAHLYVCGDAKRMARDVDMALQQIAAEHGGMAPADAKAFVQSLGKSGRYQRDVY